MINIHSIETLGAHDGPGIRTVIFFQGCPMRCVYCHNPDTFCVGGGNPMSAEEIVSFVLKYKNYFGKDGGVTLSGGEPLLQQDGAIELLTLLKENGIHTALDTAGGVYCPKALELADLIILDIKHSDAQRFKDITGMDNSNTLKTLEYLKKHNKRFWVRQVILEGFTDEKEQVRELKRMAEGAEKIELLPYHNLGEFKWQKLGLDYKLKGTAPPSKEKMELLQGIIKAVNIE